MKLMPLQIIDIHHVHPVMCFLHPLEMNFYGSVCTPNFIVDHLHHTTQDIPSDGHLEPAKPRKNRQTCMSFATAAVEARRQGMVEIFSQDFQA